MVFGWLIDLVLLLAAGLWLLPYCLRFMHSHNRLEINYKGTSIPSGMGVFIWLLAWFDEFLMRIAILLPITETKGLVRIESSYCIFVSALTVIFIIGWTDDILGHKEIKGIRGHWKSWREHGRITMGIVKAVGTGAVSLWMMMETPVASNPLWQKGLQLLLIVLMTNGINLLDVRPGRALKAFFLGTLILFLSFGLTWNRAIGDMTPDKLTTMLPGMLSLMAGALLLFPGDVKGRLMIGDTGSNLLGFSLGYWLATGSPVWLQLLALFILMLMHGISETNSITRIIERNDLLNWLDRWGRA